MRALGLDYIWYILASVGAYRNGRANQPGWEEGGCHQSTYYWMRYPLLRCGVIFVPARGGPGRG